MAFLLADEEQEIVDSLSKITPSLFTIKEGSTSHPNPLTLRGEGETAPTRRSEPLRSKVDGASEPSPDFSLTQQSCECFTASALKGASEPSPGCAGWDRLGDIVIV